MLYNADAIKAELPFMAGRLLFPCGAAYWSTTRRPRDARESNTTLLAQLRRGATTRLTETATLTLYAALSDQVTCITVRAHRVEATARLNADSIRADLTYNTSRFTLTRDRDTDALFTARAA